MASIDIIGTFKNLHKDSKNKFNSTNIDGLISELGDNMTHGDHDELLLAKLTEEEDGCLYGFCFNNDINEKNWENISKLNVDDESHYDEKNVANYGKGLSSLLSMSDRVEFYNILDKKVESKTIYWSEFWEALFNNKLNSGEFDTQVMRYRDKQSLSYAKDVATTKRGIFTTKVAEQADPTYQTHIQSVSVNKKTGAKTFEDGAFLELCKDKFGKQLKFCIFAKFNKENSSHIDGFIRREGGLYKKRYSLTKYKMAVCDMADDDNVSFGFIEKNSGLHLDKKRICLTALIYVGEDNRYYVKLGNNSTILTVYTDKRGASRTGIFMDEKNLMRNNEEGKEIRVNFDTDWCIKIDNYIIEPMFYKNLTKTEVNSPGINIICDDIILNGKTIKTDFMKSKNPQQFGSCGLSNWRSNVYVKDISYILSKADKFESTTSPILEYIIGKMHCNLHIARNLDGMSKFKASSQQFQARNLPPTFNDDFELDDGTKYTGISNLTEDELRNGWNKPLPTTKGKKSIDKKKKEKIKNTKAKGKGILYIVSWYELELMAKELGYEHLNKCGFSDHTIEELKKRYQKMSLKPITFTLVSDNVINAREVETHMWFKQPQMIENKLAERLKEHPNKEDYVFTGKELFTLDVDTLKSNAEKAIRGMKHNMSETDEDAIAEANVDEEKKGEYPSTQDVPLFVART